MVTVPRFFNTAGPIKQDLHYNVDPLKRIDLNEMMDLIQQQKYFILHAPRQTGKTSCLLALRDYLNEQGDYIAVYANVEAGQASRNNVEEVVKGVCQRIANELRLVLENRLPNDVYKRVAEDCSYNELLTSFLSQLSSELPRPLVVFIDEIDALVGDSLVTCCVRYVLVMRVVRNISLFPSYSVEYAMCGITASCFPIRILSPVVRPLISRLNHFV